MQDDGTAERLDVSALQRLVLLVVRIVGDLHEDRGFEGSRICSVQLL